VSAKRCFDVVLSAVLLLALLPLLALCGLLVLLVDGPPVLYRQVRVGQFGRPFRIVKFRSMRSAPGPQLTVAGDHRVTPLGRVLRRTKLDELPQLWNVLVGEMSLVGPRPEVPGYVETQPRGFRAIRQLRPGITDWASLAFADEENLLFAHASDAGFYAQVLLPRKLALARLYQRHRSLSLDLALLGATVALALRLGAPMRRLAGSALLARARQGLES